MPFDQTKRPLRMVIDGVDATAVMITHLEGTEEVSRLYVYHLEFVAEAAAPLKFEDVLGHSVRVEIDQGNGNVRFIHGIIRWLSQGKRDERFQHYQAELVPPFWTLTCNRRSRIFHDDDQRSIPDILSAVIGERYIGGTFPLDVEKVSASYPARNYSVQYRESDFDFVSRLMEEEGIYYYYTHTDETHGLVLADNPEGHKPLPGSSVLIFEDNAADEEGVGRVTFWQKAQQLRIGAVQISDHNFELPTNRLEILSFPIDTAKIGTVEHQLTNPASSETATVDNPGGYGWWLDGISRGGAEQADKLEGLFTENSRIGDVRIGLETSEAVRITAGSTCRWLTAGHKFTLTGHFDADGEYMLISVTHKAELGPDAASGSNSDFRYENEFTCLPIDIPFRPERITEKPTIRGTQTADVVGSEDAEIDPDKYGRVKVLFRWDPRGARGLDTSCWVRVAQFWAGRNWGAQFLPRVGDEVIVAFIEGDPDRPIIIGSVYHADNMPIYPLPDNKTKSGIKTHSSPNGTTANYNEIMFEDKKGSELVGIHAERNMNVTVENCYSQNVGSMAESSGSDTKTTGTSTTTVYGDSKYTVTKGDYTVAISAGKATVTVNKTIDISSETDHIHVKSPTEVKLMVGDATYITMTPDTITLHAAHVKIEGTTDTKIVTPDLDANGSSKVFIHGPSTKVQGATDLKLLGGTIDIIGDSKVKADGAGSKVELVGAGATMSGATAKVHGNAVTTIEGSPVNVNC